MAGRITKAIRREPTAAEIEQAKRVLAELTMAVCGYLEAWARHMDVQADILRQVFERNLSRAMEDVARRMEAQ